MGQLVGGQLGRIAAVGATTYTLIEFSEKVFVGFEPLTFVNES